MRRNDDPADYPGPEASPLDEITVEKIQCPNCCRLAPVTSRSMGLLFYQCELCGTLGAIPDPHQGA